MQAGGWFGSLDLRTHARKDIVQIEQNRWIPISFGVSSGRHSIPSRVASSVSVQAGDNAVEDSDAVGLR